MAKNQVVSGAYQGCLVRNSCIFLSGKALSEHFYELKLKGYMPNPLTDSSIILNKDTVLSIIEQGTPSKKERLLSVQFRSGKTSLLRVDADHATKIQSNCFCDASYVPVVRPRDFDPQNPDALQFALSQNQVRKHKLCKIVIFIVLVLFIVSMCSGIDKIAEMDKQKDEAATKAKAAAQVVLTPEQKVAQYSFENITKEKYPKTFKRYGAKNIAAFNAKQKAIAQYVAQSDKCDQLASIELSNNRSNVKQNQIIAYVDCENKSRYYVDINDMSKPAQSVQEITGAISDSTYTQACYDKAKMEFTIAAQQHGFKVKHHTFSSIVIRNEWGKVEVRDEWTSTNIFNASERLQVSCIFDDQGMEYFSAKPVVEVD